MSRETRSPRPEQLAEVFDAIDDLGVGQASELMLEKAKRGQKSLILCGEVARDIMWRFLTEPLSVELENMAGEVVPSQLPPRMTPEQFDECVHVVKKLGWAKKNLLTGADAPFSLEDRECEQHLARTLGDVAGCPYGLVMVEGPCGRLDSLVKQCSHLPIDFVKVGWDGEPGLRRRGEPGEGKKEAYTPLADWVCEEPDEIVEGHVVRGCVAVKAGLFESYKTTDCLEEASSIIEGRPKNGRWKVPDKYAGTPVVWVNCDMGPGSFRKYAANFGLVGNPLFEANGPDSASPSAVDSPALLAAVRGKVLYVDTMLDLAGIKESTQSAEWVEFFAKVRRLFAAGCLAVTLISHPTKSGARRDTVDPSEYLKDSVTFGGKIDVGFGYRKAGEGLVHVERIKQGRLFEAPVKYTLATHDEGGRSWISRGRFPVVEEGSSLREKLKAPRKGVGASLTDEAKELLADARRRGLSSRKAAEELKAKLGEKAPSDSTVFRWWAAKEDRADDLF